MSQHGFVALEIYENLRYLTITGDVIGESKPIADIDIKKISLSEKSTASGEVKHVPLGRKNHDALLDRIRNEKDGAKFILLYDHGDLSAYQGDQNRADMALVSILAKWSNFDTVLLDELFRGSALYRAK